MYLTLSKKSLTAYVLTCCIVLGALPLTKSQAQNRDLSGGKIVVDDAVNPDASSERFAFDKSVSAANRTADGDDGSRIDILNEQDADNETPATAQLLYNRGGKVTGNIDRLTSTTAVPPTTRDIDFYSIQVAAGDRLFAAVNTSASLSGNSLLTVYDADGTTVLEEDNDDGSLGATSSSIAGLTFVTGGVKYLRVVENAGTGQIRPYDLFYRIVSGAPVAADVEPNNTNATASAFPASYFASGTIESATDTADFFNITLNAGDTIFLSLDANPERDANFWNPRFGMGGALFGNFTLLFNDGNVGSAANSNSESGTYTVKNAGTYQIFVDPATVGTGGATFTYTIAALVVPADADICTTYNSTNVGQAIGPDPAAASAPNVASTLTIPDAKRISKLKVNLDITHNLMADIDLSLQDTKGDQVVLFNDIGSTTAGTAGLLNLVTTVDDGAAFPINTFTVINGYNVRPETFSRLSFFEGESAQGLWTLNIWDDVATNAGTLNGWGLTVCEKPSLDTPAILTQTVVSTDFELNDGGFTHNGTLDEWEYGTPSVTVINGCLSGTKCWKTDLDSNYELSANQNLLSAPIDLTARRGQTVTVKWAQKHAIENATFDTAFAEIREVGTPANARRLWNWQDNTPNGIVASPNVTFIQPTGWRVYEYDISDFAGKTVEIRWNLTTDNSVVFPGIAVDDFSVRSAKIAPTADFDGNGSSNLSVFRNSVGGAPGEGSWFILNLEAATTASQLFGLDTDVLVPGDYDGDGDTDIATYRGGTNSTWFISKGSRTNFDSILWGTTGDVPVQGDYDGDGKADVAVFRPSNNTWFVRQSSNAAFVSRVFGASGDKLVPADYNGDGRTDFAVWRPSNGTWFVIDSFTGAQTTFQWGQNGDTTVVGDYDGDRQADYAVWRAGVWYIFQSRSETPRIVVWGQSGDTPVAGDYDRDRKTDLAVFRSGQWLIQRSTDNTNFGASWGISTDRVVPPRSQPQ